VTTHWQIEADGATLDVYVSEPFVPGAPFIAAAHPAGSFNERSVALLVEVSGANVVCANFDAGFSALATMVDGLDEVRRQLGIERWVFWGMSGGGWLSMEYALCHPSSLRGVIIESVCSCFRVRLADPECILSPFHTSWRDILDARNLIDPHSHTNEGDAAHATEWIEVEGVGSVFRRQNGPALLVSAMPVTPEMRVRLPLLWTIDFREALAKIRTPSLVMAGDADPVAPLRHVRGVHDAIPDSSLFVAAGAGHVPTTTRRDDVREAVATFLQSL
jgi:pimeloyl-ACP methyl ester carboxylesterase